ncbi:hypothetical protein SPHINGO391_430058 [Sphingomonas aurantiaca]|uniref:Uncharacterized protein n=1 Tax=Sphingomonas aurantiaca TaxID=185949 RepID=A0A5E7Z5P5_9SPHN|nr:hypothetical protein SPHINGO391_430058 [Sphingomonas aurantiaca]
MARACSPSAGAAVMMLTTPPIAWLPQGTELGPRSTSIRSTELASRLPKSKPPPVEAGSLTRTPSITTKVWSDSAPRIRTPVSAPSVPLRVTVTPGVVASRSDTTTVCRRSISARSITVTAWPISLAGCATRVAVKTTSAASAAGSVWASADAAIAAALRRRRNFVMGHVLAEPPTTIRGPADVSRSRTPLRWGTRPHRSTRPRSGSTVTGRSPGFRVVAATPPSQAETQWRNRGGRYPVTVAGTAPVLRVGILTILPAHRLPF